ncbi:uncharacterized protein LOC111699485 [Eurytemora carolleeae]|uniref:uncharacterized protein LOC111699485 n=1 Tax=Eurytemora carolleeae TaxID=1294199 RepID=UPI000C7777BB|nr:uncharacterized protein LOC111699485 [Eurytemora carolleeae]|eukprot:XP_023325944.1 uncharacterized protein LOC111699485 [Eurytemora affinis]
MYERNGSLSRVYQTSYPLAVSSYIEDEESPEQDVFQDLEQERFFNLISALKQSVFKQVIKSLEKVLEIDKILISPQTTLQILKEMVYQGEREPCGVRGGTLVVLFRDRSGLEKKIGRFPLDSSTTPTYQLILTLIEATNLKVSFENLLRRFSGHGALKFLGSKFRLEKKKLYRSSTSSTGSI